MPKFSAARFDPENPADVMAERIVQMLISEVCAGRIEAKDAALITLRVFTLLIAEGSTNDLAWIETLRKLAIDLPQTVLDLRRLNAKAQS